MESVFCVNCGSPSGSMLLDNEQIFRCIQRWVAPRSIETHDLVCTICWTEAQDNIREASSSCNVSKNCVLCPNRLEPRTRCHQLIALRTDTEHHVNIRNIIIERLLPVQMRASHFICHPCWQRADRAARHYSAPSSSRGSTTNCINCGIHMRTERRHILIDDAIRFLVQQRVAPQIVTANDFICGSCHAILRERINSENSEDLPIVGHRHVCVGCGCSLAMQAESYLIQRYMMDVVQDWIQPRMVRQSDYLCQRCFRRAERDISERVEIHVPQHVENPVVPQHVEDPVMPQHVENPVVPQLVENPMPQIVENPVRQHVQRITLPNYSRAASTHNRCIFQQCNSNSQRVVPFALREKLFKDHCYYVPQGCRICDEHFQRESWHDLINIENVNREFTAAHIEDFCVLLKKETSFIDFENIERMDDYLVWYWLGRSKEQFRQLEAELPWFLNRALALGAYLMKLRTGDSDKRIAKLLKMSRQRMTKLVAKARDILTDHFVPTQIGLQHMTREDVASRNLYIPESLFGNPGAHMTQRKAIIMMDGTYLYVQKSSNYSYQKKTYSLHKYRNLVKPFIIVCCDGHIIDVLGPYPATKSDAEIIQEEFAEGRPMREYFISGDVMILDRGFRDCIALLESLNYSVHYPLSLQPGERQLSTEDANESRKVTLCRWVVEVVNGRFKRDFKLLRQEYFNRASKHMMQDFKIAAALINKFHPVLHDRDDARQIISIIQEKMFLNNTLADYVQRNRLNTFSAQFENITVDSENLRQFPEFADIHDLILISLGIYQIKQARSYYGEHVKTDGRYTIEVCREVNEDLIREFEFLIPETIILFRGKIQSRHRSNKTYFVYILIDTAQVGRQRIVQYCCNCIAGRRTIGCCAHIMTIIWYLGFGRHHGVDPPAQFLDNILIANRDDH